MTRAALALLLLCACAPATSTTPEPPVRPAVIDTTANHLRPQFGMDTRPPARLVLDDRTVFPSAALAVPPEDRLIWDCDDDDVLTDADTTCMRWANLRHDGSDQVRGLQYVTRTAEHFGLPAPYAAATVDTVKLVVAGADTTLLYEDALPYDLAPAGLMRLRVVDDVLLIEIIDWPMSWGEGPYTADWSWRVRPGVGWHYVDGVGWEWRL
jgi:hypothetical protein